jgi:hypothetical protein
MLPVGWWLMPWWLGLLSSQSTLLLSFELLMLLALLSSSVQCRLSLMNSRLDWNSRVILNEFQVSLDPCKNIWPIDSVVKRVPPSGYSEDETSAAFRVVEIHRPSIIALITYQQHRQFSI